jgi:hypothetical protein
MVIRLGRWIGPGSQPISPRRFWSGWRSEPWERARPSEQLAHVAATVRDDLPRMTTPS